MGFLVEGDLNPIGFSWIYNEGKNRPLGGRLQRDDVTQYYPGFNLTFSNVELPYDFAAGATYDTGTKRIPFLSFCGAELSRRVRSHSHASLRASLGMGPDEPGQLCIPKK